MSRKETTRHWRKSHHKYIKNIELGILFDTGKYLWKKALKTKLPDFYIETLATQYIKNIIQEGNISQNSMVQGLTIQGYFNLCSEINPH